MFFIWLFFVIGIIATIIVLIPTLLQVYIVIRNLFVTIKIAIANDLEVRKAVMEKKKETKLAKINENQVTKTIEEEIIEEPRSEDVSIPEDRTNTETEVVDNSIPEERI